jgi:hypothetical protein
MKQERLQELVPTCKVIIVEIAIATPSRSARGTVEVSGWTISAMACPTRSESEASGATFNCRDEPSSAYMMPGIDAENCKPVKTFTYGAPKITHQASDGAEFRE